MQDNPPESLNLTFNDGAAYERLMGRWSLLAGAQFLDWLAPAPGQAWLDVGCGNGAFTEVIATQAAPAALTGIDPSDAQIAYARQRAGAKGAAFQTGDAQALPFADASFDLAVMGLVISFIPDPARGLAELVRVTKPGGTVATYMWDLPGGGLPLAPLFRALAEIGHPGQMPPSAAISTGAGLDTLWRGAGLTDIRSTVVTISTAYEDFEDFWASTSAPAGPQARALQSLPPDQLADLRRRLQTSLPTDSQGRIAYPSVANAISGRKSG